MYVHEIQCTYNFILRVHHGTQAQLFSNPLGISLLRTTWSLAE
jgi:hypothetical protein